jgi:hypothetical protein
MGLVKAQMMREIDKLKVRANGLEFLVTERQKKSILYRFPVGICSLARLHHREVDVSHRDVGTL